MYIDIYINMHKHEHVWTCMYIHTYICIHTCEYEVHAVKAPLTAKTAGINWINPNVLKIDEKTEQNVCIMLIRLLF
jgi:hypothetical protein